MQIKKYLISGIGPGAPGGVGRLMSALAPDYNARGYSVIFRRLPTSIPQNFTSIKFYNLFVQIIFPILDKSIFTIKTIGVLRSEVVLLHPQTIGYFLFFYLIFFNKVSVYVMDNSFFCISSYNTHPVTRDECLKCLRHIMPHSLCRPFPGRHPKWLNVLWLRLMKMLSWKICFLAQNRLQAELIYAHFGLCSQVSIVGMKAESDETLENHPFAFDDFNQPAYDVVFHGACNAAKGVFYILQIANLMPYLNFLIPDSRGTVVRATNSLPPDNVTCIEMSWETGLREAVASARLVINPSMWSAPMEGALIKSARFNKNVATVQSQFAYEAEIESIHNHVRLPRDPFLASKVLEEFFLNIRPILGS
jgi:hypothetical protein